MEEGIDKIAQAQEKTVLPAEPNQPLMDQFVYDNHFGEIRRLFGSMKSIYYGS